MASLEQEGRPVATSGAGRLVKVASDRRPDRVAVCELLEAAGEGVARRLRATLAC